MKNMRFALILAALFIHFSLTSFSADASIRILVVEDDYSCWLLDTPVTARKEDGHTLAPLRPIAEALGYTVSWNTLSQEVTVQKDQKTLRFKIGDQWVQNNGEADELPVAPVIENGHTLVPLRYLTEHFGRHVLWMKWEDGNEYIWLSPVSLLTSADISPGGHYVPGPANADPLYQVLKTGGRTARGISPGTAEETVLHIYGTPHKTEQTADGLTLYSYTSFSFPGKGEGSWLTFVIESGQVAEIRLYQ